MGGNEEKAAAALGEDRNGITYGGFIEIGEEDIVMEDDLYWFWLVKSVKGLKTWFKLNQEEEPENIYYREGEAICQKVIEYMVDPREKVKPDILEAHRYDNGKMSRRKAWCGACHMGLRVGKYKDFYCPRCGKGVKWNE